MATTPSVSLLYLHCIPSMITNALFVGMKNFGARVGQHSNPTNIVDGYLFIIHVQGSGKELDLLAY